MSNSGPGYATNPDHTVVAQPFKGRVVVEANGKVLVDTEHALEVREANYPPVYYVPRRDTRMTDLVSTDHHTGCPYKGQASYFSIVGGAENAVWSYEHPYDEVLSIREYLAFYPNRVDAIKVEPSA
ncbi:MAG: DUF427 domain-containing protein [Polyangiaceae bacterium]